MKSEKNLAAGAGIRIDGLVQGYRRRTVLDGLSVDIPDRSIVGLVGPNGAGKTTLMRTLVTLMAPRSGQIHVLDRDIQSKSGRKWLRQNLGYLPQDFTSDNKLTVTEYVKYCLWCRGFSKDAIGDAADKAIADVGLKESAHVVLDELSGGMRQRAGIAAATAGSPDLLVLDEPTAGLDPEQRLQFRAMMRSLESRITLISTHLIEDVASLADFLVVVSGGRLAYAGTADVLRGNDLSVEALEKAYIGLMNDRL